MKKNEIKYVVILGVMFLALVLLEIYRPKPVDWTETLSRKDKIPYGTYVLYSSMDRVFPGQKVTESRLPPYNFLQNDSSTNAHYIFIARHFEPGAPDIARLLKYADAGNSVFIAARRIQPKLLDTLRIRTDDTMAWSLRDTNTFVNPLLDDHPYIFQKGVGTSYFKGDSLARVTILGKNGTGKPNFIRVAHGRGNFYLHLSPLAFSNYYILNDSTSSYAFKALSCLPPDREIIWDEYINQGRVGEQSLLRVVMSHQALRWAYYTAIIAILLFVLFESKRRQRIIPIVRPFKNTTLEFLDTVSRLYFQKQDHKGIALKKIRFLLDYIRTTYHLPTNNMDEDFVRTLSQKSGFPFDKCKYLVWKIKEMPQRDSLTVDELVHLNLEIDDFYRSYSKHHI